MKYQIPRTHSTLVKEQNSRNIQQKFVRQVQNSTSAKDRKPKLCRMRHNRRTFAKLCRQAGGDLEQIQMLLGHASIQTTERYLGSRQNLARGRAERSPATTLQVG